MLSLMLAGGPFMFATLAVSLTTVGIFISRVIFFWGRGGSRRALAKQVIEYTEAADYKPALQLCAGSTTPTDLRWPFASVTVWLTHLPSK